MENYLEAWVVVIILFAACLISAAIIYYAIRIIASIIILNLPSEDTQSLIGFIAWPFALLTWAIVDYFLFQFLSTSFYW
jgi:hypothetical protein